MPGLNYMTSPWQDAVESGFPSQMGRALYDAANITNERQRRAMEWALAQQHMALQRQQMQDMAAYRKSELEGALAERNIRKSESEARIAASQAALQREQQIGNISSRIGTYGDPGFTGPQQPLGRLTAQLAALQGNLGSQIAQNRQLFQSQVAGHRQGLERDLTAELGIKRAPGYQWMPPEDRQALDKTISALQQALYSPVQMPSEEQLAFGEFPNLPTVQLPKLRVPKMVDDSQPGWQQIILNLPDDELIQTSSGKQATAGQLKPLLRQIQTPPPITDNSLQGQAMQQVLVESGEQPPLSDPISTEARKPIAEALRNVPPHQQRAFLQALQAAYARQNPAQQMQWSNVRPQILP